MKLRLWLLVSILAFLPIPALQAQEQFNFDPVAKQAAAAIEKSVDDPAKPITVLVLDFDETQGDSTELGIQLANEFAATLRKHALGFVVLQPSDLRRVLADHHLPESVATFPPAMKCYAPDLGISVFIEGQIEDGADGIMLKVRDYVTKERESFFEKEIRIPLTSQMRDLMGHPVPEPPPFFIEEKKVWTSPEHPPVAGAVRMGEKEYDLGYKYPTCILCPHPGYADAAMKARLYGTVLINVQISAEGYPSKISLVRGIPCGLTDEAFEAVERWKFRPATNPDGVPIATEVPIELKFGVY